ncbi:MAG: hypothetical protein IPJ77_07000 [Planctomycetes bacterium]|nr:hypothetical protein [Planctomycetota bacterium]
MSNSRLEPAAVRRTRRLVRAGVVFLLAMLAFGVLAVATTSGHRAAPTTSGAVCRIEAREVFDPWDRFEVFPRAGARPGFAVFARDLQVSDLDGREVRSIPASFTVHAYPSGRVLESFAGADAEREVRAERERIVSDRPALDLDGDGRQDVVEPGVDPRRGLVRLLTAPGGRVLLEDDDDIEYETMDRVIALGDLDGDGKGECAVLHPRSDRSAYDFELGDLVFGAKSWISIVSGSRLAP